MSGQTLSEKIISQHCGYAVQAGELAIVPIDGAMATDATAPFAIRAFRQLADAPRLWDAQKVSLILDHATPAPNERVANLHRLLRDFSAEQGCHFYDVGEGICHQLMVEFAHVKPGDIFLGADSHTPTYGALGAFAVGVGSTDLAAAWLTGKTWLKVPTSVKVEITGTLSRGVSAKDVALQVVGRLGIAGATYETVEFCGSALHDWTLASRMVLANMVAEMGAKAGLVDVTGLQLPYAWTPLHADPSAQYRATHSVDISHLRPQIARPHTPDDVAPIDELLGTPIHMAFIGSCTNARLEDLQVAAQILRGKHIAPGVRLLIAPASRRVFNAALLDGTIAALSEAGATFLVSGCGPCVGSLGGIPGDHETIISSTNRNFRGRMGNPHAHIYLASPAVVATAALAGEIANVEA
ncbi:MAG TPA: 3-isopropylmalate dehydratase large subunit [Anaerolineales bacterium]|nr:3-isopropylmalate dehydratase large subunit [Anaerolineales bacterium]